MSAPCPHRALRALMLCAILLSPLAGASPSDATRDYIVRFDDLPDALRAGDPLAGGRVVRVDAALGFAVVRAPTPLAIAAAAHLGIASIEPDVPVRALSLDPLADRQYGPALVRATEAWRSTAGAASVKLCVVDTGVRHTHEDLAGARWLNGIDYENGDHDAMDDHGHGTHVAGIAAATTANGKGIAGLAQVGLLAVKALDEHGIGSVSSVASGIRWCVDEGARIVTLSLGLDAPVAALADAVAYAHERGALLIAAAGNSGPCEDCVSYPAAYPDVLAVTCVDADARPCGFSSQGPQADLAAPGSAIVAPYARSDDDYAYLSGTSMAAPHVAGVAALVWSAAPQLTSEQVRRLLVESARDLGAPGRDAQHGFGLVDAGAAVRAAMGAPPSDAPPAPNAPPVADAGPDLRRSDANGDRLVQVRLDARASHDADGPLASYAWYRQARLLATGPDPLVVLPVGSHRLTLVVADEQGARDQDELRVEALRNQRPTASFTVRCEGATCTFDANGSRDPEGARLAYAWSLDGSLARGPVVTHRFAEAGVQRVALHVEDLGGLRARASDRIFVPPEGARETFREDFESGAPGWKTSRGEGNLWRIADDCTVQARGGRALLFDHPAPACGRDAPGAWGWVASPAIDLRDATSAALRFDHQREPSERGSDRMRVEVSANGGRSWRALEAWRAGDAGPAGWHEVTLDLSRYAGQQVHVRFLYDAGRGPGSWSVDDVRVLVTSTSGAGARTP